jgi:hypothetical protein
MEHKADIARNEYIFEQKSLGVFDSVLAKKFNISSSRVYQIYIKGLYKLRRSHLECCGEGIKAFSYNVITPAQFRDIIQKCIWTKKGQTHEECASCLRLTVTHSISADESLCYYCYHRLKQKIPKNTILSEIE